MKKNDLLLRMHSTSKSLNRKFNFRKQTLVSWEKLFEENSTVRSESVVSRTQYLAHESRHVTSPRQIRLLQLCVRQLAITHRHIHTS